MCSRSISTRHWFVYFHLIGQKEQLSKQKLEIIKEVFQHHFLSKFPLKLAKCWNNHHKRIGHKSEDAEKSHAYLTAWFTWRLLTWLRFPKLTAAAAEAGGVAGSWLSFRETSLDFAPVIYRPDQVGKWIFGENLLWGLSLVIVARNGRQTIVVMVGIAGQLLARVHIHRLLSWTKQGGRTFVCNHSHYTIDKVYKHCLR